MYTEVDLTELEKAILAAIPDDEWVDRKTIAQTIGKATLNWHDVRTLNGLVERRLVTEERRKIGFVKMGYFYRA